MSGSIRIQEGGWEGGREREKERRRGQKRERKEGRKFTIKEYFKASGGLSSNA